MKRDQDRFISCGILFNHESEIRGGDFVTQKIVRGAVDFANNGTVLNLGNLDSKRDWGYAGDYVEGMWRMLQQGLANDFILATGETNTIRDFAISAFSALGIELTSNGKSGVEEVLSVNGMAAVRVSEEFFRPNEVGYLMGDPSKAKDLMGWEATQKLDGLLKIMVDSANK